MNLYHSFEEIPKGKPVVFAIGFFDGFHLGHRSILQKARDMADARGADMGIVTFNPHPSAVLFPEKHVRILETETEKERAAELLGADFSVVFSVTKEFLAESAESFLETLARVPNLVGIAVGENFTFGQKAAGTAARLSAFFESGAVSVCVLPLLTSALCGGRPISSTEIRAFLRAGDVETAAALLGRRYSLAGDVARGFRRGTEAVGFPTANLSFDASRVLPADGVYATYVKIRGKYFPAVTNIGNNPTFGNQERTVETFILDFDETIYGESFAVEFVRRLRGEIKFPDAKALARQIETDICEARKILQ